MYKTVIFFLSDSGNPDFVPHQAYVRLVRGDELTPKYARQQIRVADWYIKMDGDSPIEIENETYSFLNFDAAGHVAWPHDASLGSDGNRADESAREEAHRYKNPEGLAWQPTLEERGRLYAMVFGARQQQE